MVFWVSGLEWSRPLRTHELQCSHSQNDWVGTILWRPGKFQKGPQDSTSNNCSDVEASRFCSCRKNRRHVVFFRAKNSCKTNCWWLFVGAKFNMLLKRWCYFCASPHDFSSMCQGWWNNQPNPGQISPQVKAVCLRQSNGHRPGGVRFVRFWTVFCWMGKTTSGWRCAKRGGSPLALVMEKCFGGKLL